MEARVYPEWHRAADPEHPKADDDAISFRSDWLQLPNREPILWAYAKNWRTGEVHRWHSGGKSVALKDIEPVFEQNRAEIEAKQEEKYAEAAERAAQIFESLSPWKKTEYCERKLIDEAFGTRVGFDSNGQFLCVPLRDIAGKIWTLENIYDGEWKPGKNKKFLAGGKKSGAFHSLRNLPASSFAGKIYICEGFATAASIATAFPNVPVVAAMDAGNLEPVACVIAGAFQKATIVFCADHDESGAGEKAARSAILSLPPKTNHELFICPIESDFNDLHVEQGIEAVHEALKNPVKEANPVKIIALGSLPNGNMCFFSSETRDIHSTDKVSPDFLKKIAPLAFWQANFPPAASDPPSRYLEKVVWSNATDFYTRACNAKGRFDSSRVRGAGMWLEKNVPIFHAGEYLITPDGAVPLESPEQGRHLYRLDYRVEDFSNMQLSNIEREAILKAVDTFAFAAPEQKEFLLGWAVCAFLGGALSWRPHIWIKGQAGSGKTTILEDFLRPLLRNLSVDVVGGGTTEAGLRNRTGCASRPVIMDEAENTSKNDHMNLTNMIVLFRQASSDSSGLMFKSVSGGGSAVAYDPKFCAALASVESSLVLEQDQSRFSLISCQKVLEQTELHVQRVKRATSAVTDIENLNLKFAGSIFREAANYKESIRIFTRNMPGDARFRDQHAALAGASFFFRFGKLPTEQDVFSFCGEWAKEHAIIQMTSNNAPLGVLNQILAHTVRIEGKLPTGINDGFRFDVRLQDCLVTFIKLRHDNPSFVHRPSSKEDPIIDDTPYPFHFKQLLDLKKANLSRYLFEYLKDVLDGFGLRPIVTDEFSMATVGLVLSKKNIKLNKIFGDRVGWADNLENYMDGQERAVKGYKYAGERCFLLPLGEQFFNRFADHEVHLLDIAKG